MAAPLVLAVDDLACARGERTVLAGLSFRVAAGEALVVRGRNGAGKSTLLQCLAGLLPVQAGRIALTGGVPEAGVAEHCHYLGHLNALKASLTLAETLTFWARWLALPEARPGLPVDEALEAVGLAGLDGLPGSALSAGQKRRAAIARLLVAHRPVWLLDEPTAALDAAGEARLAALAAAHRAGGGLIVAATHQPLDLPGAARLDLAGAPVPTDGAAA